VVLFASLDLKNNLLGNRHYLLYSLVCSGLPRMLVCLDEDLKSVPVQVNCVIGTFRALGSIGVWSIWSVIEVEGGAGLSDK
jgi:hypothetical protein